MRIDELEYACTFFDVSTLNQRGCHMIDTDTIKYGVIEFFPKKNKIHINKTNKWIKNGKQWLKQLCTKIEKNTFNDTVVKKSYLTDESIMKFGKFKGQPLEDVDSYWLIWIEKKLIEDEDHLDSFRRNLLLYIQENRDVIER